MLDSLELRCLAVRTAPLIECLVHHDNVVAGLRGRASGGVRLLGPWLLGGRASPARPLRTALSRLRVLPLRGIISQHVVLLLQYLELTLDRVLDRLVIGGVGLRWQRLEGRDILLLSESLLL